MNKGDPSLELTYEQQQVRQRHKKLLESLQSKNMAKKFHEDFQNNEKNMQPKDLTSAHLEELMQILKSKISSKVT